MRGAVTRIPTSRVLLRFSRVARLRVYRLVACSFASRASRGHARDDSRDAPNLGKVAEIVGSLVQTRFTVMFILRLSRKEEVLYI